MILKYFSRTFHSTCRQIFTPKLVKPHISQLPRYSTDLSKPVKRPVILRRSGHLRTMKLNTPEFFQLFTPELNQLNELFTKFGYEIRIAGGAVRDLLSGKVPHDIDFATTATPEQMKEMFEKEEIRMLNMNGEKHGTITCRLNDKENFEVTTLRIDVVTDGRHAEVEFTRDWQLDANRRDLTVNSMFLGLDGTLYDYFNGKEDLEMKRVRFVGDAASRIQEDYLRILRYFRFYGRISDKPNAHEASTLSAIQQNAAGLKRISGERIWMELKKIVVGNHANSLVRTMSEVGLSQYIGLPTRPDVDEFDTVWKRASVLEPLPMTLMSTLLKNEEDLVSLNQRLKVSNEELKTGFLILSERETSQENRLKYFQDMLLDCREGKAKLRGRMYELFKYWGNKKLLEDLTLWEEPIFPIRGFDLLDKGIPKGPGFQYVFQGLREVWKSTHYSASKEELLSHVDRLVSESNDKFKKKPRTNKSVDGS